MSRLALVAALIASTGLAAADKPNVVLILADDLRADTIGTLGSRDTKTPNLDRLAQAGCVFRRATCEQGARLSHCDGFWGLVDHCPSPVPLLTRVPIFSPRTARPMLPSSCRAKTMIGRLLSMQREIADASITFNCFSRTS